MKKVQDAEINPGTKVLLRVGFDVAVKDGKAMELFKIEAVKETVDYLMNKKARVAMLSWLGRPGGKKDPKFSFGQLSDDIEKALGYRVVFVPDCIGAEVSKALENLLDGEIMMLENVRFYPGEGDVETGQPYEESYAKNLAENFDVFVNDALSQSHRNQASIVGIPKYIPSFAGLLLQEEVENLDKVKDNPEHPAVAIIGGAKIETKLPLIQSFEKTYDNVLVGGKIANECIDKGLTFSEKVKLPIDYAKDRLDIGPETIKKFRSIILGAKTIVWNGPMGKFEEDPYNNGTNEVLQAVVESGAFSVMGGGESVEVLEKGEALGKISFVSTGGGAMLEYMIGGQLPGLEALK